MSYLIDALKEATIGSIQSIKQISIIVIPIMLAMEILKDMGLLDRIADWFSPVVRIFGMKKESAFPLVIGIIIGLSYGAGIIFKAARENKLPKKDLYLITYFLVAAHAVFEDTAIFAALGVSAVLLLSTRLAVAALFTFLASKFLKALERGETNELTTKERI
ncbi:nucleoside recognition domain-containing protein [Caldanaerovirga acetigignens]|uniref:nucleoside recognition domain-containing protein n=1 Tax=Caldanaerovirga acetigignens TaxID=447595 RepID=UPI001FCB027B|nr:nucleoside recognition domain-containing protein [Caldanaerovirga acetigignens]